MAANTNPIACKAPNVGFAVIPSAAAGNTAIDGTGTTYLLWDAAAVSGADGGVIGSTRIKAASISTQTVARFFLNNGLTPATAANNIFLDDITLPAITASSVASVAPFDIIFNRPVNAGYRLYACLATSVTGAIAFTTFGGIF